MMNYESNDDDSQDLIEYPRSGLMAMIMVKIAR